MLRFASILTLTCALLTACSDFPELDDAVTPAARNADYPKLVPLDQVLANANDVQITEATISTLNGNVSRLRARAARLRGPIIDAGTRARMRAAIARHN